MKKFPLLNNGPGLYIGDGLMGFFDGLIYTSYTGPCPEWAKAWWKFVVIVFVLCPSFTFAQTETLVVSTVPTPTANCTIQRNGANTDWVCTAGAAASQPLTDSLGLIANASDATKVLKFDVSAIATSTTRTITWPNANVTIPSTVASLSTNTFTGLQTANGGVVSTTFSLSSTMLSDLIFTDATYDIGKSGATRPRDGFFSRNVVVGGTFNATTGTFATGASVSLLLNTNSSATTYNLISLNGVRTDTGFMGVTGGASGDTVMYYNVPSTGSHYFRINGVAKAEVVANGDFYTIDGTVHSLSDIRTKDRAGEFTPGLDAIRGIVTGDKAQDLGMWRYKTTDLYINGKLIAYPRTDHTFVGAAAQLIKKYVPEAVETDVNSILTVTTTPVFWAGMRAIVQEDDRVTELEKRLKTLETKVK